MRLHDKIMNIQISDPMHKVQAMGRDKWLVYREGHKDARHSAAELSMIADELLDALENLAGQLKRHADFGGHTGGWMAFDDAMQVITKAKGL